MFNLARFNLSRFNLPQQQTAIVFLQTDAYERITGVFAAANNLYLNTSATERLDASARMIQGILQSANSAERITATAGMVALYVMETNAQEVISAAVQAGANVYALTDAVEQLGADITIGADVYAAAAAEEIVSGEFTLGANVYAANTGYEILSAITEAEAANIFVMVLDVALEPGDTLIIDSDHYTVMKNGENALETHSGQWMQLNRNTRTVLVESGTPAAPGNLHAVHGAISMIEVFDKARKKVAILENAFHVTGTGGNQFGFLPFLFPAGYGREERILPALPLRPA